MMVPLPQTGHGCPTKVSALPVAGAEAGAEGIEAGDGEDAGTFDSAFAFFSLGALALRSRFLGSFFAFSYVWATAS